MCSKPTNWEDLVQDDNRCLCGILLLGNHYTSALNISMMLMSCHNLFFHINANLSKYLIVRDC